MPAKRIERQVYKNYQSLDDGSYAAAIVQPWQWGKTRQARTERLTYEYSSDYCEGAWIRRSRDNGKTFSPWLIQETQPPRQGTLTKETFWFANCYDEQAGHDVRFDFQRIFLGTGPDALAKEWQGHQAYYDHGFYCLSTDDGVSFSQSRLLRFEDGALFDDDDWAAPAYLKRNTMYGGYTAVITKAGKLLYPFTTELEIEHQGQKQLTSAARCMIGTWDAPANDYRWQVSNAVSVPLSVSGRGFMEPAIAQLSDGRVVMGLRGSTDKYKRYNPDMSIEVTSPGYHWLSLSEDGGTTFSPARPMGYDNGDLFYSPSSFARFLRHSNGKLYWIGNISADKPRGNMPRHPLVIAQVDEQTVGLVKSTLAVIDTKGDNEEVAAQFQLSNFSAFENPQSKAIELYMTRYGEAADNWLKANAYRYTIQL